MMIPEPRQQRQGRVAMVTSATHCIGLATAEGPGAQGASEIVRQEGAETRLGARGEQAAFVEAGLTFDEQVDALIARVMATEAASTFSPITGRSRPC